LPADLSLRKASNKIKARTNWTADPVKAIHFTDDLLLVNSSAIEVSNGIAKSNKRFIISKYK
jgi:hypothetical protein